MKIEIYEKILPVIFLALLINTVTIAQITTMKVAEETSKNDHKLYDSTENLSRNNVYGYVGQDLYLKELRKDMREYGYFGFLLEYDYKFHGLEESLKGANVYKCCSPLSKYNSNYDSLVGKYFNVLDVIKDPNPDKNKENYGPRFYIKLQEKHSGDIIYYEYRTSAPFIVVGYFEKQKKAVIGEYFIFSDNISDDFKEIKSGKVIASKLGQIWKCIDLVIEEENKEYSQDFELSLLLENSAGEKILVPHRLILESKRYGQVYSLSEAKNYRKKFGEGIFNLILQNKLRIGMTKEMCRLSWGEPNNINETIFKTKKSEQWVYLDGYLYFNNETLSSIQNSTTH